MLWRVHAPPWQAGNNVTILIQDATLDMQHFLESEVRDALERHVLLREVPGEGLFVCLK